MCVQLDCYGPLIIQGLDSLPKHLIGGLSSSPNGNSLHSPRSLLNEMRNLNFIPCIFLMSANLFSVIVMIVKNIYTNIQNTCTLIILNEGERNELACVYVIIPKT